MVNLDTVVLLIKFLGEEKKINFTKNIKNFFKEKDVLEILLKLIFRIKEEANLIEEEDVDMMDENNKEKKDANFPKINNTNQSDFDRIMNWYRENENFTNTKERMSSGIDVLYQVLKEASLSESTNYASDDSDSDFAESELKTPTKITAQEDILKDQMFDDLIKQAKKKVVFSSDQIAQNALDLILSEKGRKLFFNDLDSLQIIIKYTFTIFKKRNSCQFHCFYKMIAHLMKRYEEFLFDEIARNDYFEHILKFFGNIYIKEAILLMISKPHQKKEKRKRIKKEQLTDYKDSFFLYLARIQFFPCMFSQMLLKNAPPSLKRNIKDTLISFFERSKDIFETIDCEPSFLGIKTLLIGFLGGRNNHLILEVLKSLKIMASSEEEEEENERFKNYVLEVLLKIISLTKPKTKEEYQPDIKNNKFGFQLHYLYVSIMKQIENHSTMFFDCFVDASYALSSNSERLGIYRLNFSRLLSEFLQCLTFQSNSSCVSKYLFDHDKDSSDFLVPLLTWFFRFKSNNMFHCCFQTIITELLFQRDHFTFFQLIKKYQFITICISSIFTNNFQTNMDSIGVIKEILLFVHTISIHQEHDWVNELLFSREWIDYVTRILGCNALIPAKFKNNNTFNFEQSQSVLKEKTEVIDFEEEDNDELMIDEKNNNFYSIPPNSSPSSDQREFDLDVSKDDIGIPEFPKEKEILKLEGEWDSLSSVFVF